MATFVEQLLYEIQKKYPTAKIDPKRAGWIDILHRDSIAVMVSSYVRIKDGKMVDYSYLSFDYYGRQKNRDNDLRLTPDFLKYGDQITPAHIANIAAAVLRKVAPLYKKAVAAIDAHFAKKEREEKEEKELHAGLVQLLGQDFEISEPDWGSVKIRYHDNEFEVSELDEKVELEVPLNKLKAVLDILEAA